MVHSYVVDFWQRSRDPQRTTRGLIHGPANAAVRPDRDHYDGRIWKVQHKEAAKTVAGVYRHRPEAKGPMGSAALKAYEAKADALRTTFKTATDDWTRSAVIAASATHADNTIIAALASPEGVDGLVNALLPSAQSPEKLLSACAAADAKADGLKVIILQGIAQQVNEVPALTPELTALLKKLLANPSTASAALPLVVKWDKAGALASDVKAHLASPECESG